MTDLQPHFHLFVYGSLRSGGSANAMLGESDLVGRGSVGGVLYDIDGQFTALVMYGASQVEGEVWRCPASKLESLDEYERVNDGLFRRVGAEVRLHEEGTSVGCWTYVAGPALGRKLVPARRIENSRA